MGVTLDKTQLTSEQQAMLENYEANQKSLILMGDIADMTQEMLNVLDGQTSSETRTNKEVGALLMDMRDSLITLKEKEEPESPDFAKPVVEAVGKLEKALSASIKSIDVKPHVDSPKVNVNPQVDLSGVEKVVADIPKAFEKAIKLIPKTEIPKADYSPLLEKWDSISEQLLSIENAARMKPLPGTMASKQAGSWSVGTQTISAVKVGQTTSNATAQRLNGGAPLTVTNGVLVQALAANTNKVYIGDGLVTSSNGFELQAGQSVPFTVNSISDLYVIGGSGSDKVCWSVM